MTKKQILTVAELKSLFVARFKADQIKQTKLTARVQQALGNEVQEKRSEAIVIEDKLISLASGILARRLKYNRRSTPLISSRDVIRLAPCMIDEIEKVEGEKLDARSRKILEKSMRSMLRGFSRMMDSFTPPSKDPYEEYWRWIMTVLTLATERGVSPTALFGLEETADEIVRRIYTEKQFITLYKRMMNKSLNVEVLKEIIVGPIIDAVSEGNQKER